MTATKDTLDDPGQRIAFLGCAEATFAAHVTNSLTILSARTMQIGRDGRQTVFAAAWGGLAAFGKGQIGEGLKGCTGGPTSA